MRRTLVVMPGLDLHEAGHDGGDSVIAGLDPRLSGLASSVKNVSRVSHLAEIGAFFEYLRILAERSKEGIAA